MKSTTKYIYRLLVAMTMTVATIMAVEAFDTNIYAERSVLADGNWVKISVPESGLYKITSSQLTQWGFNDLSRVKVYGYGGQRIPDLLSAENYIDDLPLIQTVTVSDGVVFYGVGPDSWVESSGYYRRDNNPYTTAGYYFVTDSDKEAREITAQGTTDVKDPLNNYYDRLHYELDLSVPGEAGYILVGESFKTQNDRKYSFATPDLLEGSTAWLECALVSKTFTSTQVEFFVNGEPLASVASDKINAVSNSAYIHGDYTVTNHTFTPAGSKSEVKVSIRNISSTQNVWLDYLTINYQRNLVLPSDGYLNFWSSAPALSMEVGSADNVVVWDVTDPSKITMLNTTKQNGNLLWGNDYSGMRTYAAWTPEASLPSPKFVKTLTNQNLHGMDNVEMVIFTLPEYKTQAERIATIHRNAQRPLKVSVLNVEDVYNEFASGSGDVSALRKCLKMLYDRSLSDSIRLGYALLLGRATYDNRHLTSQFSGPAAFNTIPYYINGLPKAQFSDNTAFGTDDFIAMLEDGSGLYLGMDILNVAVGRMPVTSPSEAKSVVDKLFQYIEESASGTWKNSFLFLADDGDNGIHASQTEDIINCITSTPDQQNFISKVYVDAYDIIGGKCEGGREDMYRMLDEGIVWWNFCGHANNHSWTGESMLTYTDITSMYLKKIPILMAATCDFLRWDSNTISGGELMFNERNGGVISAISATRPVYISDNGLFTKAIGRAISKRDSLGTLPRLGDIYRIAKNNIINDNGERRSNPNRLRYVLMGDPAMTLPTPSNIVRIDSIAGEPLTAESQITLKALQQADIIGSVCNPQGQKLDDMNGHVQINIYDAERSITTKGVRDDNVKLTFEQHGGKLFSGLARVENGRFLLKVAMPGEVADNFRPALMNMYACSDDKKTEAVGVNRDFYVYGYDETAEADSIAPTIETMALNHSSFKEGDTVNESPMLIAEISDNIGINLSSAGIGHQMVLTLDGRTTYNDVSMYYTPSSDGSPSGTIAYPLSDLQKGEHTLQLKVWDTSSNSATKQINFAVDNGVRPTIFNVYTDVNPAKTEVKFFVNHNRPEAELTVTIEVFDLLGHPLWETTAKGLSNMFVSAPVTWNLCDASGRRLPRGIYLYRATISADNGETYSSEARRLAVTAY